MRPGLDRSAGWAASPRGRAWLVGSLVVVALAGAWSLGPVPPAWYPGCAAHRVTGLHCPGCGSARALQAVLHGDWFAAARHNLLLAAVAPALLAWGAAAAWRGIRRDLPPRALPAGAAGAVLIAVVAFTIARNLPWAPFRLLAPG